MGSELDARGGVVVAGEGCVAAPQSPHHLYRLVQSTPALLEVEADRVVICRRRARADAHNEATAREQIDGTERLGEHDRSSHDG
jgi:hypothetical protein